MKHLFIIIFLLAASAYSMPAETSTDYFGQTEDPPTTVMAVYYEEGTGLATNAGVSVRLGTLFGLSIYEIPSFQVGDENIEANIIDLGLLKGLGKGWYIGPIVTPLGIDWATDVQTGTGNLVAYVKAAAGGIIGKSFSDKVGMGLGVKYKRAYDENAQFVSAKWQGGLYLTANL